MAIFNVNESSLDEYLNEHGGAHRRYAEMIADKDRKLKKREEAFRSIGNDAANRKADKTASERNNLRIKNIKYINGGNSYDSISNAYENRRKDEKSGENANDLYPRPKYTEAKKNFKKDFGGKSKDTINTNDRKPGTYLAAQKKLREAAEYILAVLDEAENNKNRKLNIYGRAN